MTSHEDEILNGEQKDNLMAQDEVELFIEYDEVLSLLSSLSKEDVGNNNQVGIDDNNNETSKSRTGDAALARLRIIFDKYLECPTLLDPHLEIISSKLCSEAKKTIHLLFGEYCSNGEKPASLASSTNNDVDNANDTDNSKNDMGILESELQSKIDHVSYLKRLLSALYALCKVRGCKNVQKFLPHEASDLEPVMRALRHMNDTRNQSKKPFQSLGAGAYTWESEYSLLLWLGMLSLVPFDLNTIDSSITSVILSENDEKHNKEVTLVNAIQTIAKFYLKDPGPTRDMAASCLASLLSRPDLEDTDLQNFVTWSNSILEGYLRSVQPKTKKASSSNLNTTNNYTVFEAMGVLQTLANIFKTGSRSILIDRHLKCVEVLWDKAILLAEWISPNAGKKNSKSSNGGGVAGTSLMRKLLVKLFARVGCSYMPPRVASWRYMRGRRSLVENLAMSGASKSLDNERKGFSLTHVQVNDMKQQTEFVHKESSLKQNTVDAEIPQPLDSSNKKFDIDDSKIFHVPDQVEDSMAQLIQSLCDPATIVRWSSAKGIGRVTERLPSICADDVLDAILEMFRDREKDNSWHGACLALAELARRGLLLPKRLDEVVPVVVSATQYDVRRGQHSIGAHVRDAACYTCWAFARAYAPSVLGKYIPQVGESIVLASLFDREINCRRAASASLQECVGRQGSDNFRNGISILTKADYYSLGNREDSYTSIAREIAKYEEYRLPIISHVAEIKLFNWDIEIRILASKSIFNLVSLDPKHFAHNVLPVLLEKCTNESLEVRHGAIVGVAELILSLSIYESSTQSSRLMSDETSLTISEMVQLIEKKRLYRGRGGEIMRAAISRLIETFSLAKIPLTVKQQVRLLDSLDANLKHPKENIQIAASNALHALMRSYFPVGAKGPSDRLQKRVVSKYIDIITRSVNPAETRGYTLALGKLPEKLLAPNKTVLDSVINCLVRAANPKIIVGDEADAETRRNAIQALISVCKTVGLEKPTSSSITPKSIYPTVLMNNTNIQCVFKCLCSAMNDYNTDRRGDVGSWSRIAAMHGLESLVYVLIDASPGIPQPYVISGKSMNNEISIVIPPYSDRLQFYEMDAEIRVKQAFINNTPFRVEEKEQASLNNLTYFNDEMCIKILGALFKQLSEKLDAVRLQAGLIVERLLLSRNFRLPFVPDRRTLLDALDAGYEDNSTQRDKNWAMPSFTFPMMVKVMCIDYFFEEILSGIIISVGCLTESVTKFASSNLLVYLRELKSSKDVFQIKKISNGLITLFEKHQKNGRVIIPLLKTFDKILSRGCFDDLFADKNDTFVKGLITCLKKEAFNCKDVHRLIMIISLSIGLLHEKNSLPVQDEIWRFIMKLLTHRYPKIRRLTSENLYVKLLEDTSYLSQDVDVDSVVSLLSTVMWDQDLDHPYNVRESRNVLAKLLGISLSEKELKGPEKQIRKTQVVDEYASYASLVNDSGR